jgi:hypothetical protein
MFSVLWDFMVPAIDKPTARTPCRAYQIEELESFAAEEVEARDKDVRVGGDAQHLPATTPIFAANFGNQPRHIGLSDTSCPIPLFGPANQIPPAQVFEVFPNCFFQQLGGLTVLRPGGLFHLAHKFVGKYLVSIPHGSLAPMISHKGRMGALPEGWSGVKNSGPTAGGHGGRLRVPC